MNQAEHARRFKELHVPGEPLVLYNIWDAGGARALADAGAQAIATGSWSVAAAHGYADGEAIPLDFVLQIVARITASVDLPVTVDFEGGYAEAPEDVAANVGRLIAAGTVGLNFEDQIVGGDGLHGIEAQARRIAAIREVARGAGRSLFINARTDLFLRQPDRARHGEHMAEAIERARAYAAAGADGFFVPALVDAALVEAICEATTLPVNVMMMAGSGTLDELARLGVARLSFGPGPYLSAVADLAARFRAVSNGD